MTMIDNDYIADLNRHFYSQLREGAIIKAAAPGTDRPAAGWYQSNTGDITLDDSIEFDTRLTIEGLVAHEASHSLWSNWLTIELINSGVITMAELSVIKTLEEARIEANSVDAFHSRKRLRACYNHLLADGFADPANYTTVAGSITCWALAWGRTHSGVVDPSELEKIDVLVRDRFGDFPMDCFDDLLSEFVSISTFGDYRKFEQTIPQRVLRIAREWLELLKSLQDSEGGDCDTEDILVNVVEGILGEEAEGVPTGSKPGEEGDEGEAGEGSSTGEAEGDESGTGDESSEEEGDLDQDGHGFSEGERSGWAEVFGEAAKAVSATPGRVPEVKRMSVHDRKALIWANKKARSSKNWRFDTPKPVHHQMVTRMAKALEKDATPAVVRTRVKSQIPPGRLNGRGAMTASADRAGGRMTVATPWRASKRHHVERPPVIIGVATDTSGSMSRYTNMLGEAAWVVAHASKRVNAKFAAVTFGEMAEPVVAVGETPDKIRVRSANSGWEAFDNAMASLDGPLRLTENGVLGRKLLIVVSDGEFVGHGELDKAILWLTELQRGGTDVIWVGVNDGSDSEYPYKSRIVTLAQEANVRNVKWLPALSSAEDFVAAILDNLKSS